MMSYNNLSYLNATHVDIIKMIHSQFERFITSNAFANLWRFGIMWQLMNINNTIGALRQSCTDNTISAKRQSSTLANRSSLS